jgi:hypothetical protein
MDSAVIEVNASYIDIAHQYNEDDIDFYQQLPNFSISIFDLKTGKPAVAAPSIGNNVRAVIVAVLSSTVLSTSIETYLKKEPTKIEISVRQGGETKRIAFEGPDIKQSQPEIEALLKDLTKDSKAPVHIVAKRKNHPHYKANPHCDNK